jgi:hypothetical protein
VQRTAYRFGMRRDQGDWLFFGGGIRFPVFAKGGE